jgi:tRNA/tmRNA/rRNA uracil-C5-methylase (TrmA/RlmC/RlmD family)
MRAGEAARATLRGQRFEVTVGPVAHGGFCVARHDGQVVFVRHALPGERVVVAVTEGAAGDRFLRADAVEVLTAVPGRVRPPCPLAGPGRCGGCDWQHADLATQRELKAAVVGEQLRRLAGIERAVVVEPVPDLPGARPGLGWRSRVRFGVDEQGRLGLRRHRSHQLEPVAVCPLATEGVTGTGATQARWPAEVAEVEVVAASGSSDRLLMLTPTTPAAQPVAPPLAGRVSLAAADERGGFRRLRGRPAVREVAAGHTWRVSGSGFWQVHPAAADTLVDAVLAGLDPATGERALDLYSGVGLFAGALAERVGPSGQVVAVESDPGAVADAAHNLRRWPWARIERARVDRWLAGRAPGRDQSELVVLDPPRSGAGRAVSTALAAARPRRIGYVACDPAALARDLGYLTAAGYRLRELRAFDLFPMTHHVECVAVLEAGRG